MDLEEGKLEDSVGPDSIKPETFMAEGSFNCRKQVPNHPFSTCFTTNSTVILDTYIFF